MTRGIRCWSFIIDGVQVEQRYELVGQQQCEVIGHQVGVHGQEDTVNQAKAEAQWQEEEGDKLIEEGLFDKQARNEAQNSQASFGIFICLAVPTQRADAAKCDIDDVHIEKHELLNVKIREESNMVVICGDSRSWGSLTWW
ncbi:unnamed protein product [Urochloa humidicola]